MWFMSKKYKLTRNKIKHILSIMPLDFVELDVVGDGLLDPGVILLHSIIIIYNVIIILTLHLQY